MAKSLSFLLTYIAEQKFFGKTKRAQIKSVGFTGACILQSRNLNMGNANTLRWLERKTCETTFQFHTRVFSFLDLLSVFTYMNQPLYEHCHLHFLTPFSTLMLTHTCTIYISNPRSVLIILRKYSIHKQQLFHVCTIKTESLSDSFLFCKFPFWFVLTVPYLTNYVRIIQQAEILYQSR